MNDAATLLRMTEFVRTVTVEEAAQESEFTRTLNAAQELANRLGEKLVALAVMLAPESVN